MIYSAGCEYGIRALMNIAAQASAGEFLLLRKIIGNDDLPSHFVGKILQSLVREGLLISAKGRGGGFALQRPPEKILLREVVEALDGSQRIKRCILGFSPCDGSQACPQHDDWVHVRDQIERLWDTTTLADLVRVQRQKQARGGRSGTRRR